MWIRGLSILNKPLAHLHTQFNQRIPWDQIDMDFMNLNQAAHGDREFGHLLSRMRLKRKVIVGHWKSERVVEQLGNWMRAALGWCTFQQLKVARFGDNMRDVAVTEGDKVAAQVSLGFSVNGYGLGDLVEVIKQVEPKQVEALIEQYQEEYLIDQQVLISESLKEAARIELGLGYFLQEGGFGAFTNTFENLHGLHQLPGIAVQRLMNDGYGFGAEGDWKTAALLRIIKVMNEGLIGGSSFMEDYTYHFTDDRSLVLGAHMLEICPSIAGSKPKCEVHPLSIGGKEAPARLVFDVNPGAALNLSLVDMGNRFRLLANKVKVVQPEKPLPKLPVARVLWDPQPSLEASAHCWLLAGGAHHTVFSMAANIEMIEDLAEMAGIELLLIDHKTTVSSFKDKIHWNEAYYHQFQNNV
jgi:L-arabinose isomerase